VDDWTKTKTTFHRSSLKTESALTKIGSVTSFKSIKNLPGQHGFGYLSESPVRQTLRSLIASRSRSKKKKSGELIFSKTVSQLNFKPQPRPLTLTQINLKKLDDSLMSSKKPPLDLALIRKEADRWKPRKVELRDELKFQLPPNPRNMLRN